MENVKIGFVGVGGMGQCAHLRNYAMLDNCDVAAVCEVKPELGKKVAEHYNIPHVYTDFKNMLKNEKLDGIVCCQQFEMHGQILPEILESNIPLFTEKPIASSLETGEMLVKKAEKSDGFYMVGYHKRSDPASMFVKKLVNEYKNSNELGKLKYVRIIMPSGDWVQNGFAELISTNESTPPMAKDPVPVYWSESEYMEYFYFVNYYIHQVNFMRYILGEDYKVTYADPAGVLMTVSSESEVTGTIEMTPYRTTVDWQESILVCFEQGWIKLDLPAPLAQNKAGKIKIFKDIDGKTPETTIPTLPSVHAMKQQAMNFISAIKGEIPPMCNANEALKDLKTAKEYMKLWKNI